MNTRIAACVAVVILGAAAVALTGRQQPPAATPPAAAPAENQPPVEKGREADLAAIQKAARDFTDAFNKADAKAVAALWTEQGECQDAGGEVIRGRAAIEKAFADFFKKNPGAKIEVRIESVRFPTADLAVEEGILRQTRGEKGLPTSTVYSTTHIREGGVWRIAVSKEWGAGVDRIEDLEWLIGTWKAKAGEHEVTLTFAREADKPVLSGRFTRLAQGKAVTSGTMRIALDLQSGQVRSWHFDDDGGHGQALWARDGNNWVLDSVGVLADGTETASVGILGRVSDDTITWRSIDRIASDKQLPDTVPLRLTRVPAGK